MLIVPLFLPPLLTQAQSLPVPIAAANTVEHYLQPANSKFPDMASNYQTTVVIPEQQAEAAAEAARQAQEAQAAQVAPTQQNQSYTPQSSSSGCSDWLAQAGITDVGNAMYVINIESGCNPNARNPNSGACGIGQQLPCGKWPHVWNDPIGGLIDMQNYVVERYGSWAGAAAYERSHGNY